jgi:hypothetical protein
MTATIAVGRGGGRRTVVEGLAGLDAIAAGRDSDSDLVRAVVAAIYSGSEEGPPPGGPEPAGEPAEFVTRVLERCRQAGQVLRTGTDPVNAQAYRRWVQQVAARVCGASRSGGVLNLGAERISVAEGEFLDELADALS